MTVETAAELAGLQRIGRIVGLTLQEMKRRLRPGMTTAELDEIGAAFLAQHGARSAPKLTYGFPGTTCISINEEAAHGVPGKRVIRPGDLVNIDVSAELDGFFADTAATIPLPPISPAQYKLCRCAQKAMQKAIASARVGRPLNAIGQAAENIARRCGFSIIRNLPGHGTGRHLHEEPSVPGYFAAWARQPLAQGLVITVEPFVSTGASRVIESDNGWTLKTADGSLSAQYEHTIVVTRGRPLLITAV